MRERVFGRQASTVARAVLILGCAAGLVACTAAGAPPSTGGSAASSAQPGATADREITFLSGGVTVHASVRMPARGAGPVPGALIIAGSGPTDRDGNSPRLSGKIDVYRSLADRLAANGVATLRYDKLGSGATGAGPYAGRLQDVGYDIFVNEARDGLRALAGQPGIDPTRLIMIGHSEGGVIAESVAADPAARPPGLAAVVLLEPLPHRYLDTLGEQLTAKIQQAEGSGTMSAAQAADTRAELSAITASLRTTGALPATIRAPGLRAVFTPGSGTFLASIDRVDPVAVAGTLPAGLSVLMSCADQDIQVGCPDLAALRAALGARLAARFVFVHLGQVDHMLKEVGAQPSTGDEYTDPALPFSAQLTRALVDFLHANGL